MSGTIEAITMPKWGLAMTEGTVLQWNVAEGDQIQQGQEIVEIETSKITNVFESPVSGPLRRLVVAAGTTVPVGALLAVVADKDVTDAQVEEFIASFVVEDAGGEDDAAMRPRTVEAGGRRLQYVEMGSGEGTPVLFVHGFGSDANAWMFVQPTLAESHRTLAVDLPGHGGSQKDVGEATPAYLAGVIADFLDATGTEAVHVVGHSLGGAIALHLALNRPQAVRSLSLIASAGLGSEINSGFISGFIEANRRKELKPVLEQLVADPELVGRDMIEGVLRFKRLDGAEAALRAVAEASFPGGKQGEVLRDRLGELACPVQVVWGIEDAVLPIAHSEALPDSIAVHRLQKVGHMPHMEASAEVARRIQAILG